MKGERHIHWVIAGLISLMVTMADTGMAASQRYPERPIRIVTGDVGSGSDFAARLIAQGLTSGMGQQVVVENRGGGVMQGEIVSRALPDGHTLLYIGGTFWLLPLMRKHVPYDPIRDFAPVTLAVSSSTILVVHPSMPVKSVKELIALAQANPGELNYGSAPAGSSNHLAAELFKSMAGVSITRVPYKGVAAALNDVVGGRVQLIFAVAAAVAGHVKSGRLRALAVTSAEPSPAYPDLPTVAATVPGYEAVQLSGLFAPAKTPGAIITRLNQETVRVLNTPEIKGKLANAGVDVVASSPQQFADRIKSEMQIIGKIITDAGIRDE